MHSHDGPGDQGVGALRGAQLYRRVRRPGGAGPTEGYRVGRRTVRGVAGVVFSIEGIISVASEREVYDRVLVNRGRMG